MSIFQTACMQHSTKELPQKFDLAGFLKLIRVNNLLIIIFTQYMVKLFLIDESLQLIQTFSDLRLLGLVSATVLIAAAGYIINDYYDIKIDTINKPERVIIGRFIKRRVALGLNFLLNFIALWIAYKLSKEIFWTCFFSGFLLWVYSNQLKRLPLLGNLSIAFLTAVTVIILVLYNPQNHLLVYPFGMFAFFITLIREIVKDMEDMRGDETFGCKTLPIIWGIRRTKQVIYIFYFTFATILLFTYFSFPTTFALYLYGIVLPPLVYFFVRLVRADTRKDFHYLSQLCKAIMVLGVLSMVLI